MQTKHAVSLNAVRVFTQVAATGSISAAADKLNVTPSAVSHQIKKLEQVLGVSLFTRKNNSITLTSVGSGFYDEVITGIGKIERAIDNLNRDANEISLLVALSFAVRWLIPALEDFRQEFPLAKVKVETFNRPEITLNSDFDLAIFYRRITDNVETESILLRDFSRPVISPILLQDSGYQQRKDVSKIPAITCTDDNWDWIYWEKQMMIKNGCINYVHKFDSDDAAIRAAVAGLGMVLATPLSIREELSAGTLVELQPFEPLLTGYYCAAGGHRKTKLLERFHTWMLCSLSGLE